MVGLDGLRGRLDLGSSLRRDSCLQLRANQYRITSAAKSRGISHHRLLKKPREVSHHSSRVSPASLNVVTNQPGVGVGVTVGVAVAVGVGDGVLVHVGVGVGVEVAVGVGVGVLVGVGEGPTRLLPLIGRKS